MKPDRAASIECKHDDKIRFISHHCFILLLRVYLQSQAGVAQLVERNLAKVKVAGSNLVSRSEVR